MPLNNSYVSHLFVFALFPSLAIAIFSFSPHTIANRSFTPYTIWCVLPDQMVVEKQINVSIWCMPEIKIFIHKFTISVWFLWACVISSFFFAHLIRIHNMCNSLKNWPLLSAINIYYVSFYEMLVYVCKRGNERTSYVALGMHSTVVGA